MISAKEANALYDQSGAEVDAFMARDIEPVVTAAASTGKQTIFIYRGSEEGYKSPRQPDAVESAAITRLLELGYAAVWKSREGAGYVPRGADGAGNGPIFFNYGIQISW
jgi:hypothetical protein